MSTITLGERLPFDVTWRVASIPSMTGTHVHQDDVRTLGPAELDGLRAVGGSAHDPKVGLRAEQCRESGADDLLVVHDDDADRHAAP